MKDVYPLPRIDDSLRLLGNQQWFCTMDLASGYWQVAMSEDAKRKAAFVTHEDTSGNAGGGFYVHSLSFVSSGSTDHCSL